MLNDEFSHDFDAATGTLTLHGCLDADTAPELLAWRSSGSTPVTSIDCAGLQFLAAAGISALLAIIEGRPTPVAASIQVRRVIALCDVAELLVPTALFEETDPWVPHIQRSDAATESSLLNTHPTTEREISMSTDKEVTENIIEILEDGKDGFAHAAKLLAASSRPELAPKFEAWSRQREGFAAELEEMAASYGDDIDESGSTKAAIHRAWMTVKDTLSGDDPKGVLDAAEQGEDAAVAAYEDGIGQAELSTRLREVLQGQFTGLKAAHDEVKALRDAHS